MAPDAPVVFFNMGLAESRIPTRELRAIAWFGAYLAAYPTAPNAAQVRAEIAALQVRSQSVIAQVVRQSQDIAIAANVQYHGRDDLTARVECSGNVSQVARLWASTRDADAAYQLVDAARLCLPAWRDAASELMVTIASEQARNGLIADAYGTVQRITAGNWKANTEAMYAIGLYQGPAGDPEGARRTLDLARAAALNIRDDPSFRSHRLGDIAEAQARLGDAASARITVSLIDRRYRDTDSIVSQIARGSVVLPPSGPQTVTWRHWLANINAADWPQAMTQYCRTQEVCPLFGAGPFVDLTRYLTTLTVPGDAEKTLDAVTGAARQLVQAQRFITEKLEQQ